MPSTPLLLLLLGCAEETQSVGDTDPDTAVVAAPLLDADEDGYPDRDDCNDAVSQVHPGAAEDCDGFDNDCDGGIDNNPEDPGCLGPQATWMGAPSS